jgi:hypothetical protein
MSSLSIVLCLFYIITRYYGDSCIKNHKEGGQRHRSDAVRVKYAVSGWLQAAILRKVLLEAVVTLK